MKKMLLTAMLLIASNGAFASTDVQQDPKVAHAISLFKKSRAMKKNPAVMQAGKKVSIEMMQAIKEYYVVYMEQLNPELTADEKVIMVHLFSCLHSMIEKFGQLMIVAYENPGNQQVLMPIIAEIQQLGLECAYFQTASQQMLADAQVKEEYIQDFKEGMVIFAGLVKELEAIAKA